jgi:hypothetical protein
MTKTFKLKKGEISFEPGRIRILDDAKGRNNILLLRSVMWTIFGLLSVLRYLKTGDQFFLWTGFLITITYIVIFVLRLSHSSEKELSLEDIKSIRVREVLNNTFLDIKLKNRKIRRALGFEHSKELDEYIQANIIAKIL